MILCAVSKVLQQDHQSTFHMKRRSPIVDSGGGGPQRTILPHYLIKIKEIARVVDPVVGHKSGFDHIQYSPENSTLANSHAPDNSHGCPRYNSP